MCYFYEHCIIANQYIAVAAVPKKLKFIAWS